MGPAITGQKRGAVGATSCCCHSFNKSCALPDKKQRIELAPSLPSVRETKPKKPCWRTALSLTCKPNQQPAAARLLSLPPEILDQVLRRCSGKQIAALEATCRHFVCTGAGQRAARQQLACIPRAPGLAPAERETWVSLLHFVQSQSDAAAQATALSLGSFHTAVILARADMRHGHALCTFGRGFHGQLGQGSFNDSPTPKLELDDGSILIGGHSSRPAVIARPAVVACGSEHTATISSRGQLFTWGLGGSGELGWVNEQPLDAATPRPVHSLEALRMVSVCAGANHTLAISEKGEVWSCGRGRLGQLGLGHYQDQFMLCKIPLGNERIVAVAAGHAHSVALASDGTVRTWGAGRCGQLGHEVIAGFLAAHNDPPVTLPIPQALCALDPAKLLPNHRVTAIAAGANHTMALTVGGSLLAFGCNKHGGLGVGDTVKRTIPTEAVLGHLQGESGAPVRVLQVVCGRAHTLILAHSGGKTMVCAAGYNYFGQLGLGHTHSCSLFTIVPFLQDKAIVAVASGEHHCAAVSATGQLFLWGRGDCGQLGMGTDRNLPQPTLLPAAEVIHPNVTLRRSDPPPRRL